MYDIFFVWIRRPPTSQRHDTLFPTTTPFRSPLGRRLLRIFDRLVDQARREPDDGMVSALVRAQDEDGDRLSDAEIVSMVFLLLFAGHDTTSGDRKSTRLNSSH